MKIQSIFNQLFLLTPKEKERNIGIDLLRAVAMMMVLFSHGYYFLKIKYSFLSPLNSFSTIAVDLFFTLSGFLIGNIFISELQKNKTWNRSFLQKFYMNRWFKTLPGYYLLIIIYYLLSLNVFTEYSDYNWKFLVFLQNIYNGSFYFFSHSYSLSIEECFYILFPFMLILFAKIPGIKDPKYTILIPILIFIILPIMYRSYLHYTGFDHWDSNIRKSIPARMDAIGFGLLGSFFFNYFKNFFLQLKYLKLILAIISLVILQWILLSGKGPFFNDVIYFSLLGLFSVLLIPFFYNLQIRSKWSRIITYMSVSSYSIYLLHLIVRDVFLKFIYPLDQINEIVVFILYSSTSLLLGFILWALFERPIMNLRNRR